MVLKDYHCTEHGYFEGWEDRCPMKGCHGDVSVVFLRPVAIKSERTKRSDAALEGMAKEFQMTDIKSTREGEAQPPRFGPQRQQNPFGVQWGDPRQITGYNTAPIADESTNGLQLAKDTGRLGALRPSVVQRDHENLSIEK